MRKMEIVNQSDVADGAGTRCPVVVLSAGWIAGMFGPLSSLVRRPTLQQPGCLDAWVEWWNL